MRACYCLLFTVYCLFSCSEVQEHTAPAINERDSVSMMTSYGVNTLISDSGVIKYKIVTERWDVNTVRKPSRWTFEKGKELFWDGIKHEFYSYKFSKVVTPERTMQGTRFRSDEHMMHYEVTNSVGSFLSEDSEGNHNEQASPGQQTDSVPPAPMRPAATRKKATPKPPF